MTQVPEPGFAGDDGTADAELLSALGSGEASAVQAALLHARVFVPLMAVLGETEIGANGLAHDKTSDIAVVTVQRPDGARALPVFSSTAALAAWDPDARPLPIEGPRAALATYTEEAVALLVDPGADSSAVLFGPMLLALAEGRRWAPAVHDDQVAQAVAEHVPAGVAWRLEPSSDADACLVLTYPAGTSRDDAREETQSVAALLAEVPLLRARLSGGIDVVAELREA